VELHRFPQAGEPYRALQLFRSMQATGMEPSPVLWTGLICQLCQQGSPRRTLPSDRWAYELWDEFAASGIPLDVPAYAAGAIFCDVALLSSYLWKVCSEECLQCKIWSFRAA
jgi:hypothetical protein